MIKSKNIKFALLFPLILAGCNNNKEPGVFKLSYEKGGNGYYISVSRYNHTYKTISGSLGARFDKNNFRLDDPIYSDYSSVKNVDDGILATGNINSEYGSTITFNDFFKIVDNKLLVNREFKVTKAGEDIAFTVDQKWVASEEGTIIDRDWFVPAAYYVNGDHSFLKSSSRTYFGGDSFVVNADGVSACAVASLQDGFSFSMIDTTSGHLETSACDIHTVDDSYLNISEDFNVPGIFVNNNNSKVEFSHIYPSFTSIRRDHFDYRALPVTKGLKRKLSYQISFEEYPDFDSMYTDVWSKAYSHFGFADKRYSLTDVRTTLLNYVEKSYAYNNMWGDIPQYMTTADHYFPDSGFLYRNIEMATFMLRDGYEKGNVTQIENALTVINYQLDNDCIDLRMRAYSRENSVFNRVLFDGLASVVDLYAYIKQSGYSNPALEEKLFNYIVNKAALYQNTTSLMALSFYTRIYKNKDILFLDYDDVALRLGEFAIEHTKEYYGYYGAIENSNEDLSCAEDYMIIIRGLMNIYETNKNSKYLRECERISNYLETFNILQPMNMNPVGATGADGFNQGFIGNERFLGYGYAFNNTNHHILDCPTTSTVIELYKLYKYTNNEHYLTFLEQKLFNALLYINMGDKVGHMDDPLHSSGDGFINEFAGNDTAREGYADGGIRGAVHDSVIGWNIYEILYGLNYLKDSDYVGFSSDYSLVHDLAKGKTIVASEETIVHPITNIIDEYEKTYYTVDKDSSFIVDLNEQCDISSIKATSDANIDVSISNDSINFRAVENIDNINSRGAYVKFDVKANTKVSDIKINGVPTRYINITPTATIMNNSGSMSNAIDKSNYNTVWNVGVIIEPTEMILDLGGEHEIYETALMFGANGKYKYQIEVSLDNNTYEPYGASNGDIEKSVFVEYAYKKARYVKLTLEGLDSEQLTIKDFKILGQ